MFPKLPSLVLILVLNLPVAAAKKIEVGNTLQALRDAIGTPICETDADCHVVGVGAKACGGPEGYLPWSSRTSDATTIQSLAEQHKTVREAEIAASGEISTCEILLKPAVHCQAKRCELQLRSAPAGKDIY